MLLVSFVILALWFAGLSLDSPVFNSGIILPVGGAIGSGVTIILGLVAYFLARHKEAPALLFVAYLSLIVTTLFIIFETGHASSPFIALWMVVSIFSGMFGIYVFGPVVVLAAAYATYLTLTNEFSSSELYLFVLAFGLPVFVSYLIWHQTRSRGSDRDQVVNALTQELSQVASKSDIVINAIGDGVVAVDKRGIIQLINPAAQNIIGWGKQDALELDYRSVLKLRSAKGETLVEELDPVQRCLKANDTFASDDLSLETNSGKKILISILVSPLDTEGGGAIAVFRNITKQKSEEREQAEFISTASHEMRTPVAAIEGYLGLALNPQTATIDDKARTYLEKAHESAQHLGRLFQDLLDVSRAEDGRLKTTPVPVDAVTYVRDLVTAFEVKAKEKGLSLVFKPDTSGTRSTHLTPQLFTMADPDHYREIVSNLIENALKYTKAGDVTVDITGDNDHVTVSIQDTGIGIPAEDITHLFQKFYRVDNTDTREIGGTGLGLYLCRRLAEAMGGRMYAKSDYGNGSTFSLETPRISQEEAATIQNAAQQTSNVPYPVMEPAADPNTPPTTTSV